MSKENEKSLNFSGNGDDYSDPFAEERGNADSELEKPKKSKWWIYALVAVVLVAGTAASAPLVMKNIGDGKVLDKDYKSASSLYSMCFGMYETTNRANATKAILTINSGEPNSGIDQALETGIRVKIKYDLNGGHFINSSRHEQVELNKKEDFADFYNATKEFYEFKGWDVSTVNYSPEFDDSLIEVSLKAKFDPEVYDISYTNLFSDTQENPTEYTYESETITLKNPSRVGYTFVSWKGTDIKGESGTVVIPQGSSGNRAYIAIWDPNKYKVTLTDKDGYDVPSEIVVTYDDVYALPTLEKRGYTYHGWDDGKTVYTTDHWKLTNDITVKPKFTLNTYTLKYDLANGKMKEGEKNEATYNVHSDNIKVYEPERFGYTFQGWTYEGQTSPKRNVVIPTNSVGDYNFTAVWAGNRHTISLNLNGGTASQNSVKVVFGDPYTIPTPTRRGYNFTGYTENSTKQPTSGTWNRDEDVKLLANWEAKTYTVKFDGKNGQKYDNMKATYDKSITLHVPKKTGYTFIDWYRYNTPVKSGVWQYDDWGANVDVTAVWRANNYTITYNLNDNTGKKETQTVTFDQPYTLKTPTRKGYTFNYWYDTKSGSKYVVNGNWTKDGNLDLTAKWTPNIYKLTFNSAGGSSVSSKNATFDSSVSMPSTSRTGYNFLGWYDKDGIKYESGIWKTASNLELIAKWDAKEYTVKLDPNGGTVSTSSVKVKYDNTYAFPTPQKKGHTFGGWKYSGTSYETVGKWTKDGGVTLTASWTPNVYDIILDVNGGSIYRDEYTVTYGKSYSLDTPSRTGYTFDGWYRSKTSTSKISSSGTYDYDHDLFLVARWEGNTYRVSYNTNGGTLSSSYKNVTFGDAYKLATPERVGYDFAGWYYGSKKISTSGEWDIANDITVTAKWEVGEYVVKLDANGGKVSKDSVDVTYSEYYTLPTPTQEGYTFDGWYEGSSKVSSSGYWNRGAGAKLTAKWTANTYTISFYTEYGSTPSSMSVRYESRYTLPELSNVYYGGSEYKFLGWYDASGNRVTNGIYTNTSSIRLTAKWQQLY